LGFISAVEKSGGKIITMTGKKGTMEMWQIIMIILALILLFFVGMWYFGLNETARKLLDKLSSIM
jgi:uncharacterized protein YpmS